MTTPTAVYYEHYIRTSNEIGEIAGALAKAQASMKHPAKSRENTHFKNRYAELADVIDATRCLNDQGIAVMQSSCLTETGLTLTLMFAHTSGQWQEGDITIPVGKPDAQGVGSALTYARRYLLSAMCNVASEDDDDGNEAARQRRERPVEAPEGPVAISADNVAKVEANAHEIGAEPRDVGDWVATATGGRTRHLPDVYTHEIRALRDARDLWLAARRAAADTHAESEAQLALTEEKP